MTGTTELSNARIVTMRRDYSSLDVVELRKTHEYLRSLAEHIDANAVILDFSQTECVGAGFVRALEDFSVLLEERGVRLTIAGMKPFCADTLQIASPNRTWAHYPSTSAAVRRLLHARKPAWSMGAF